MTQLIWGKVKLSKEQMLAIQSDPQFKDALDLGMKPLSKRGSK